MREYAVAPIEHRGVAMRHVGPRDATCVPLRRQVTALNNIAGPAKALVQLLERTPQPKSPERLLIKIQRTYPMKKEKNAMQCILDASSACRSDQPINRGESPTTMARSQLVDVSITRWYHRITPCLRRAF
jgi:hypothetical protein